MRIPGHSATINSISTNFNYYDGHENFVISNESIAFFFPHSVDDGQNPSIKCVDLTTGVVSTCIHCGSPTFERYASIRVLLHPNNQWVYGLSNERIYKYEIHDGCLRFLYEKDGDFNPYAEKSLSYDGKLLFDSNEKVYAITNEESTDFDLVQTINSTVLNEYSEKYLSSIQQSSVAPHQVYAKFSVYGDHNPYDVIYKYSWPYLHPIGEVYRQQGTIQGFLMQPSGSSIVLFSTINYEATHLHIFHMPHNSTLINHASPPPPLDWENRSVPYTYAANGNEFETMSNFSVSAYCTSDDGEIWFIFVRDIELDIYYIQTQQSTTTLVKKASHDLPMYAHKLEATEDCSTIIVGHEFYVTVLTNANGNFDQSTYKTSVGRISSMFMLDANTLYLYSSIEVGSPIFCLDLLNVSNNDCGCDVMDQSPQAVFLPPTNDGIVVSCGLSFREEILNKYLVSGQCLLPDGNSMQKTGGHIGTNIWFIGSGEYFVMNTGAVMETDNWSQYRMLQWSSELVGVDNFFPVYGPQIQHNYRLPFVWFAYSPTKSQLFAVERYAPWINIYSWPGLNLEGVIRLPDPDHECALFTIEKLLVNPDGTQLHIHRTWRTSTTKVYEEYFILSDWAVVQIDDTSYTKRTLHEECYATEDYWWRKREEQERELKRKKSQYGLVAVLLLGIFYLLGVIALVVVFCVKRKNAFPDFKPPRNSNEPLVLNIQNDDVPNTEEGEVVGGAVGGSAETETTQSQGRSSRVSPSRDDDQLITEDS